MASQETYCNHMQVGIARILDRVQYMFINQYPSLLQKEMLHKLSLLHFQVLTP